MSLLLRLVLFDGGDCAYEWSELIAVGVICELFATRLFGCLVHEVRHLSHSLLDGHFRLGIFRPLSRDRVEDFLRLLSIRIRADLELNRSTTYVFLFVLLLLRVSRFAILLVLHWESADCRNDVRLLCFHSWLWCVESVLVSLLGALGLVFEQGRIVRVLITASALFVCLLFGLSERMKVFGLDLAARLSRLFPL